MNIDRRGFLAGCVASISTFAAPISPKAVVAEGGFLVPTDLSASDIEFLVSRSYQLDEIARLFSVPLHMFSPIEQ